MKVIAFSNGNNSNSITLITEGSDNPNVEIVMGGKEAAAILAELFSDLPPQEIILHPNGEHVDG